MELLVVCATVLGALCSIVAVIGTLIIQSRSSARIEGGMLATQQAQGKDITELKEEQDDQWEEINSQGKDIAALQTKTAHL